MSNNNQHQIHDIFFRKSMEQPAVAIDFLKSYLPKGILSRIDLSTLKQQKESFIEKDIGQGVVDCLYQVELLGNDRSNGDNKTDQDIHNSDTGNSESKLGYIYCLLEHQTKPDRFMALRLVKYMVSIIEYHRKKHRDDKYLPIIYPLVLYTGLEKYTAPISLIDLFRDRDLAYYIMSEFYQLIDINQITDEKIKEQLYSGAMMYIYKHRLDNMIADRMELIKDILAVIMKDVGIGYIAILLKYLINASDADEDQSYKIIEMFTELANEDVNKEKIMTIADNLRQQGMQQGIEEMATNMLKEGLHFDVIKKITSLSQDELSKLEAKLNS